MFGMARGGASALTIDSILTVTGFAITLLDPNIRDSAILYAPSFILKASKTSDILIIKGDYVCSEISTWLVGCLRIRIVGFSTLEPNIWREWSASIYIAGSIGIAKFVRNLLLKLFPK